MGQATGVRRRHWPAHFLLLKRVVAQQFAVIPKSRNRISKCFGHKALPCLPSATFTHCHRSASGSTRPSPQEAPCSTSLLQLATPSTSFSSLWTIPDHTVLRFLLSSSANYRIPLWRPLGHMPSSDNRRGGTGLCLHFDRYLFSKFRQAYSTHARLCPCFLWAGLRCRAHRLMQFILCALLPNSAQSARPAAQLS